MTEHMRQNGAGQSKWAFVDESTPSIQANQIQDHMPITKSLNDKKALTEMFTDCTVGSKILLHPNATSKVSLSHPEGVDDNLRLSGTSIKNKFDTHEYAYQTDTANKKYPGVDNHCSLLGYCTNVNLPNTHSLDIISTNKIPKNSLV
jgi:hypothetical protein